MSYRVYGQKWGDMKFEGYKRVNNVEVYGCIWDGYLAPKQDILKRDVKYIGTNEDYDIYECNSDLMLDNGCILEMGSLLVSKL